MKNKTKLMIIFILIFILMFPIISFGTDTLAENQNPDLNIHSEAIILLENKSGKILYEKNSEKKMYPASTTKILTAILAIEKGNLDDIVTVSSSALAQMKPGYSSAYLVEGEMLSVENLITLLLVHSANDASNVLAEYISGSIEDFVNLMNEKAVELGCQNSHFVTTNGLHDDNHYTTAKDLSIIARYCMQNPTFRKIVSMKTCTIPATNRSAQRIYKNTNDLLNISSIYYYQPCIGIKTGYTSEAKNCLVSACVKDNLQLISVILGASFTENNRSARYVDAKTIYDYAYSTYAIENIAKKSDVIDTIEVKNGTSETKNLGLILENDITALVNTKLKDNINYEINLNDKISAPIDANSVVGTVTYTVDGDTYTENLLASHEVIRKNNFFMIFLIFLVGIFLVLIGLKIILRNKKNKRNKGKRYNK